MREIGDRIGITEPAAQRIVAEAATTGYITRQRNGPRNQYGGWGVDALLGERTRSHDDLDLVIARRDCSAARTRSRRWALNTPPTSSRDYRHGLPSAIRATGASTWGPEKSRTESRV